MLGGFAAQVSAGARFFGVNTDSTFRDTPKRRFEPSTRLGRDRRNGWQRFWGLTPKATTGTSPRNKMYDLIERLSDVAWMIDRHVEASWVVNQRDRIEAIAHQHQADLFAIEAKQLLRDIELASKSLGYAIPASVRLDAVRVHSAISQGIGSRYIPGQHRSAQQGAVR